MSRNSVSQQIVVAADSDTVMDVVADVEAYPEWQPDIQDVEVLDADEDGWARQARFTATALGLTATFVLAYSYTDHEMRWELVDSDVLTRNDGAYQLADRGDGTTEVTYTLEVDTSLSVPGFLRRQLVGKVVDAALRGVKRRAEAHV